MEPADIIVKPKLAFVGLGWIGRNRLQAAVDSGFADIIMLTDPSEACITEGLAIAQGSIAVSSYKDVLEHPEINGVVIATPSGMHKEQAIQAFKKDKAVFCQKPLSRTSADVSKVIETARKANRLLGVDFCYRYIAAFQMITHHIRSGELGKIFAVDLKFHNAYGPDKPWFYDINSSGGGCVLDLGIHMIDLMFYALDFPEVKKLRSRLYSKGVRAKETEVEDYANVLMDLGNDATATLSCSWNLQAGAEAVIEATFYGTNGAVALKNINGSFYDFQAVRYWGTKTEIIAHPPDAWGGRALIRWIRNLGADTGFNKEAECYLPSAEVIDKIYGRL
ncbi:MAG TPA: Gfo/Idh/MocA family oxidoreductase [Segetibacter sp.]